jgi:hypothetical protein
MRARVPRAARFPTSHSSRSSQDDEQGLGDPTPGGGVAVGSRVDPDDVDHSRHSGGSNDRFRYYLFRQLLFFW